jgi:hypothetical protein
VDSYFGPIGGQAVWEGAVLGPEPQVKILDGGVRDKVYIGQSGRSVHLRIKEHDRHLRLAQTDKSAIAEHSFNHNHRVQLQVTNLLSIKTGYMERLNREAIENEIQPHHKIREEGFHLSKAWKRLLHKINEKRLTPDTQ